MRIIYLFPPATLQGTFSLREKGEVLSKKMYVIARSAGDVAIRFYYPARPPFFNVALPAAKPNVLSKKRYVIANRPEGRCGNLIRAELAASGLHHPRNDGEVRKSFAKG